MLKIFEFFLKTLQFLITFFSLQYHYVVAASRRHSLVGSSQCYSFRKGRLQHSPTRLQESPTRFSVKISKDSRLHQYDSISSYHKSKRWFVHCKVLMACHMRCTSTRREHRRYSGWWTTRKGKTTVCVFISRESFLIYFVLLAGKYTRSHKAICLIT